MSDRTCTRHDGSDCAVCTEEQQPGESHADWLARLGAIASRDIAESNATCRATNGRKGGRPPTRYSLARGNGAAA